MSEAVNETGPAEVQVESAVESAVVPAAETLEQKIARITIEINDYLSKQGLQLQVDHRVSIMPIKKAE